MNDLSKLKNKKQIIYDFDGTIATIVIDWAGWHVGAEKIIQEYDPTFVRQGGIYQLQNDIVRKFGESIQHKLWKFTEDFEYENCTGLVVNIELVDYIKNNPPTKTSHSHFEWAKKYKQDVGRISNRWVVRENNHS